MPTKQDTRRKHERIKITVPASLTAQGHTLAASTRDLSQSGLFLFTDAPFEAGSEVEVVLMLPPELGLPTGEMVCCHGRVIRVELEEGRCGIAATVDKITNVQPA